MVRQNRAGLFWNCFMNEVSCLEGDAWFIGEPDKCIKVRGNWVSDKKIQNCSNIFYLEFGKILLQTRYRDLLLRPSYCSESFIMREYEGKREFEGKFLVGTIATFKTGCFTSCLQSKLFGCSRPILGPYEEAASQLITTQLLIWPSGYREFRNGNEFHSGVSRA